MRTPIHFENNQKKRRCLISILIPILHLKTSEECRDFRKSQKQNTLDFISIATFFWLIESLFSFSTSNFWFPSVQYIIELNNHMFLWQFVSFLLVIWWITSTLNSQTLHKEAGYSCSNNRPSRLIYKTWIWFNTINHHLLGLRRPSLV